MPAHFTTQIATSTRLAGIALLAGLFLVTNPSQASAQVRTASGSIGVSMEILQPVATQPVHLSRFAIDKAGVVRFDLSAPVSGPASQIVMTRVSRAADVVGSEQQPMIVHADRRTAGVDTAALNARFSYRVEMGGGQSVNAEPLAIRVEYLAVAGT